MIGSPVSLGRAGPAEVWRLDLDLGAAGLESAWTLLSAGERRRAEAMPRAEVRNRYVAARAGVRRILAGHVDAAPGDLVLATGPMGKPLLPGGPDFSLSHADGVGLCAVAVRRQVGVDVERVRPVPEAPTILDRWFGESEVREWLQAGRSEREFIRLWTRREAYLKALGTGFFDEGTHRDIDLERWEVHDLEPIHGHLGAVVVERHPSEAGTREAGRFEAGAAPPARSVDR